MRHWVLKTFAGIALTAMAVSCSTQYRNVDAQISQEELLQLLENAGASSSSSSVTSLLDPSNESTVIYFADAPGPLGSVASVASFYDWSWLGFDDDRDFVWNVEKVSVFLLDGFVNNQRKFALIVRFKLFDSEQITTKTFESLDKNGFVFDKKSAVIEMTGPSEIVLTTFDVDPDIKNELAGGIQLKVGVYKNGEAQPTPVGKFSALQGFGP